MKTELEKKLDKLPNFIIDKDNNEVIYDLHIYKNISNNWIIRYVELASENTLISSIHTSLQAAVDNTLKEIKKL